MQQITAALRRVRGVDDVKINTRTEEIVVTRTSPSASNMKILGVLQRMGFRPCVLPFEQATLRVPGMSGEGNCERVRLSLCRMEGVRRVRLTLTCRARVTYDTRRVQPADLAVAIRKAGFNAVVEG